MDATQATEPVQLSDGTVVPPGAHLKEEGAEATQPVPSDESAQVEIQKERIAASSGKAGFVSQTLGQLGILVWIGAACFIAGIIFLAIKIKMRANPALSPFGGYLKAIPWWTGPLLSLGGIALIAAPHFIEVATPHLVRMFIAFVVFVVVVAAWIAWKNRFKIEKKTGLDIAGKPGIGQ